MTNPLTHKTLLNGMNSLAGSYALLVFLPSAREIRVGRLGAHRFEAGWYAYAGSAFGPGGVRARLKHHFSITPRPHWHIDYLRANTEIHTVWFTHDPLRREHLWTAIIAALPGAIQPVPGFGATDCTCAAHLFRFHVEPEFKQFVTRLLKSAPDHAAILRLGNVDSSTPASSRIIAAN